MTIREKELEMEIKFWRDLCSNLMNSDDTGFVSIEEAVAITGLSKKTLRRHTENICLNARMIPVPWIKWYMQRTKEGFVKLPRSDLHLKKPQS